MLKDEINILKEKFNQSNWDLSQERCKLIIKEIPHTPDSSKLAITFLSILGQKEKSIDSLKKLLNKFEFLKNLMDNVIPENLLMQNLNYCFNFWKDIKTSPKLFNAQMLLLKDWITSCIEIKIKFHTILQKKQELKEVKNILAFNRLMKIENLER